MNKFLVGLIIVAACFLAYNIWSSEQETYAVWRTSISNKIYSELLPVNGDFVFWNGNKGKNLYKLTEINKYGQRVADSVELPNLPFAPIVVGDTVVMADYGRMLRGFSVPGLDVAWEAASPSPISFAPLKCGDSKVIQASGKNSIFCFDAKTGKQLWDIELLDDIKSFDCDKSLVVVHGYTDVSNPIWKCVAYDIEDGNQLWVVDCPVSKYKPVFVKNACILTTNEGEPIIVDQTSGNVLYSNNVKGYIAIKGFEDSVMFVSSDYKQAVYFSLIDNSQWSVSLDRELIGAAKHGSKILIVDKSELKCLKTENGEVLWTKKLGDAYEAYPFRNGIFVTYKEYFTSRTSYGTYFDTESAEGVWTAIGKNIFKKPYVTSEGDLLVNYDGSIRMMPKPVSKTEEGSISDIQMPDPMKNVNQIFEKNASQKDSENTENTENSEKSEDKKNVKAKDENLKEVIPSELPVVSDSDAGW